MATRGGLTPPAGFGRSHVAPLVPRFRELHPEVTISLNLSDRVVDLAAGGFACAVQLWVDYLKAQYARHGFWLSHG